MSSKKEAVPIYKRKLVWIVAGFMFFVFISVFVDFSSDKKDLQNSVQIQAPPSFNQSNKPPVDAKPTEKYQEQVIEYSLEESSKAEKRGETYIQQTTNEPKADSLVEENNRSVKGELPISLDKPPETKIVERVIVDNTEIEKLKKELEIAQKKMEAEQEKTKQLLIKEAERQKTEIQRVNYEQVQAEKDNINKVFGVYAQAYNASIYNGNINFIPVKKVEPETSPGQDSKKQGDATKSEGKNEVNNFIVHAGDMLYAKNKIAINTDYSSQNVVQAEVISSDKEKNGSILFGSFVLKKDTLVLSFNRMILPNKKVISIEGYAINENDYTTSVRTEYDNHYLERWGLYAAGKFTEGLAKVALKKADQGTTVVYDANGNPVGDAGGTYTLNPLDEVAITLGEVATDAAGTLKENLNRPPTVTLDRNATFGVVLMNVTQK